MLVRLAPARAAAQAGLPSACRRRCPVSGGGLPASLTSPSPILPSQAAMSSPGQPPTASPAAVAPAKPVQRRTSLDVLMRDGSVAAAAAGQAGLGLGLGLGSQDLTGLLLDPSLLQHMQSLPRGCWGGVRG